MRRTAAVVHLKIEYQKWTPLITTKIWQIFIYLALGKQELPSGLGTVWLRREFVWFPPPLCVGSALASICSSCSFGFVPPPPPANTRALAQLWAEKPKELRDAVAHPQRKQRAVHDDGMARTGINNWDTVRLADNATPTQSAGIIVMEGHQAPI